MECGMGLGGGRGVAACITLENSVNYEYTGSSRVQRSASRKFETRITRAGKSVGKTRLLLSTLYRNTRYYESYTNRKLLRYAPFEWNICDRIYFNLDFDNGMAAHSKIFGTSGRCQHQERAVKSIALQIG